MTLIQTQFKVILCYLSFHRESFGIPSFFLARFHYSSIKRKLYSVLQVRKKLKHSDNECASWTFTFCKKGIIANANKSLITKGGFPRFAIRLLGIPQLAWYFVARKTSV